MKLLQFQNAHTLRIYSSFTAAILSIDIILLLASTAGIQPIQSITGPVIVIGVVLLLGQILLTLNFIDKENETGWIVHRLSYVTLFVVLSAFLLLSGSSYLTSFYIFGAGSLVAGAIISSICLSMLACFGICLSSVCCHTLKIEGIWRLLQSGNQKSSFLPD